MESDFFKDESEQIKDLEIRRRSEFQQIINDCAAVIRTPAGKRLIWHLLEQCHVFTSTFTGNSRTYFLEGKRSIGLYLLALMQMSGPEGLAEMQKIKGEEHAQ